VSEFQVGSTISWETWNGNKYKGEIVEKEDDCLHVMCTDGIIRTVNYERKEIE
jgi:hypothetical protein